MSLHTITIASEKHGPLVVAGQTTACPFLYVTQSISSDLATGEPRLSEGLVLTHAPTGMTVGSPLADHQRLAAAIAPLIDWDFTNPARFRAEEPDAEVIAVRDAIRQHFLDFSAPLDEPTYGVDPSAPADSLLAQQLTDWQKNYETIVTDRVPPEERTEEADRKLLDSINLAAQMFGTVYLLAVLRAIDPAVADVAATELVDMWEAGDSLGEWIWQWNKELHTPTQLSLHAIPQLGDLR